jgi:hypothetical protein
LSKINQTLRDSQDLAALAAEVRALLALNAEVARRLAALGRAEAIPVDTWLAKATPDQLLDRWRGVRGNKAEAFLLDRIFKRRGARRIAL